MKRKVYVMDCGDFVKIGVSGNVEQRATQIPYKVKVRRKAWKNLNMIPYKMVSPLCYPSMKMICG